MTDNPGLLYRISSLYYERGLTQEEIAKEVSISRPMVSRALDRARALGIVRIQVIPPLEMTNLSGRLEKLTGIKRVLVVPCSNGSDDKITEEVAEYGAKLLEKELWGDINVGFGWGNTVYRTVMNLTGNDSRTSVRPRFVPLMGSIGRTESAFQINAIVNYAAEKLNGEAHYFNVSMLSTSEQQAKTIMNQYSDVCGIWSELDVAVVGIGPFLPKPAFPFDVYDDSQLEYLKKSNVKGDMLGRFFNDNGFVRSIEAGYSYVGIPEEDLKRTKDVICICSGTEKIPAIISASKQKLFSTLVTDYRTASGLETALGENEL